MCDYPTQLGPCPNKPMEGSRFCEKHTARSEDLKIGQYMVSRKLCGESPLRHLESDELKSLKAEIALLRAMVEKRWNMLENNAEFISSYGTMKDSFLAIEKLVTSCHAMEVKLDELMSKPALLQLAQTVVKVIQDQLPDMEDRDIIVERIGLEIAAAIQAQTNV